MNIITSIKHWFKPKPEPKIRIRFNRDGDIAYVIYPAGYSPLQTRMLEIGYEGYRRAIKYKKDNPLSSRLGGRLHKFEVLGNISNPQSGRYNPSLVELYLAGGLNPQCCNYNSELQREVES